MGVLVALTAGLVFWITGWALGIGSFDSFLVTIALVVGALAARAVGPFLKQQLGGE
ncbi:MAG: hypothetical protein H0U42_00580 [Thermoleophilaceae bacterium]|nr:hypothetical protein [Thermoleophilaceae bacterium]